MPKKPINIEQLLETMGFQDHIADPEHRYELRRRLLCSRFFEVQTSRWDKLFTYTAPLFVGGMMVGVFALMAVYAPMEPEVGHQTQPFSKANIIKEDSRTLAEATVVTPLVPEDFLSDPKDPLVKLADFETVQTTVSPDYIPLSTQSYVRVQ